MKSLCIFGVYMKSSILKSHKHTLSAAYLGHITQAIINNFTPLLFLTFEAEFSLSLSKITLLVTSNFLLQLIIDLVAASFVDRIGYRKCIVAAHLLCSSGLLLLGILPDLMPSAFCGIMLSLFLYALGGGLIEVLIAPIVEACPCENKSASMSLLHFFYSAGHVGVVIISAFFFLLFGIENWRTLAIIWALIPTVNTIYFLLVPIYSLPSQPEIDRVPNLLKSKIFLLFILLMFVSGASEQSMNQWASAFAESALASTGFSGYAKIIGDLCGPCVFALMMGLSRLLYSRVKRQTSLEHIMTVCSGVCAACYLLSAACPLIFIKLLCCGLCGLSIGIAWPGIYVLAGKYCHGSSTALFALLALGGDLGCAAGPTIVGFVSDSVGSISAGLLCASVFPLLLLVGMLFLIHKKRKDPILLFVDKKGNSK